MESSPFHSLTPKKVNPKSSPSDQEPEAPDRRIQWSSKTPEKPSNPPPCRARNARTARSIKEVKEFAMKLQQGLDSRSRPDPFKSQQQQPAASPSSQTYVARSKKIDGGLTMLPEKYEILDKFFNSLDSSIRLLQLKGSMSAFTKISPKIEYLTNRRFSYGHLAQLKFILPEAIEIEKVLIHDEHTSCMKPDLHVTLNINAIENDKKLNSNSGNLLLRKVFRARLLDFYKAHPEVDDVPEEALPEPFNQLKQDLHKASNSCLIPDRSAYALSEQQLAAAAILPNSYRRHFSKQVTSHESANSTHGPLVVSIEDSALSVSKTHSDPSSSEKKASISMAPSTVKFYLKSVAADESLASKVSSSGPPSHSPATSFEKLQSSTNKDFPTNAVASIKGTPAKIISTPAKLFSTPAKIASNPAKLPPCHAPATPFKELDSPVNEDRPSTAVATNEGTPAKLTSTPVKLTSTPSKIISTPAKLSTPVKLMSATPALQPTKRCYMSPDDDLSISPAKLTRRPQRSRSLKFDTPMKSGRVKDGEVDIGRSADNDLFDILPEDLLQSIREKERRAQEEQDPAISQARRRQQMIVSLPKFFDMLHFFLHSINRSIVTKEELVHKLVASNLDIVDRREVEEQLRLLQELVPDWLSEKSASSGDLLLCINKTFSPELIRTRLAEAK
ncbi:hypothetical protein RJ639_040567 [Escallonia herrerae]|uniref:CDT1 Geminin-binding domain-containing protein n=1 Tax=Escallonia herrerae TaxID=1293975 RepID=A0AA88WR89_9ASTE|nr:hypothetical protein RJ639_040567 [Escallonia herrerae]